MKFGISRYPYYHSIFRTDESFEVYGYNNVNDAGIGIALFGNKKDAEEYLAWREKREEGVSNERV